MCTIYYERFCLARFYILACVGVGIHNLKVYLVATWIISCFNELHNSILSGDFSELEDTFSAADRRF